MASYFSNAGRTYSLARLGAGVLQLRGIAAQMPSVEQGWLELQRCPHKNVLVVLGTIMLHTTHHRGRHTCSGKSLSFVCKKSFSWTLLDPHWKQFSPIGNRSLRVQLLWFSSFHEEYWGDSSKRRWFQPSERSVYKEGQRRVHWGWVRPQCHIPIVTMSPEASSSQALPIHLIFREPTIMCLLPT